MMHFNHKAHLLTILITTALQKLLNIFKSLIIPLVINNLGDGYIHMHTRMHVHIHAYMQAHTVTQRQTHTHTHTHTHTLTSSIKGETRLKVA